jgi:hypothetical protein
VEKLLEPRSLKPIWGTWRDPISKKLKEIEWGRKEGRKEKEKKKLTT